jgi:hypothetical protein
MKLLTLLTVLALMVFTAGGSRAESIILSAYVDDEAAISIDGTLDGSYDNAAAAGNIVADLNLSPGWHDIVISYANQAGTNFLSLSEQYPGETGFTLVPLTDFQSVGQSGDYISGLRADYFTSWGGTHLFTVYGEGPILNGATSFTSEIYEGVPGLWAGVFGPSADFGEVLSGQIHVAGAPEPSSAVLGCAGVALLLIGGLRRRGWAAGR